MKFKFLIFLLSLLALNNIQSASLSNEQLAKLEQAGQVAGETDENKDESGLDIEQEELKDMPDALKNIIRQYAIGFNYEEIAKANDMFQSAETEKQMREAINNGADLGENLFTSTSIAMRFNKSPEALTEEDKINKENNERRLQFLLDNGANPNYISNYGYVLRTLVLPEYPENRELAFPILKTFLDYGADITIPAMSETVKGPNESEVYISNFWQYLNAPGSEGLLKLYNDYMDQKAKNKEAEKK